MANGLCSKCGVILTSDNCSSSRFSHGGPCYVCRNQKSRLRYRNDDEFRKRDGERNAKRWKGMSSEQKRHAADNSFRSKYGVSVLDFGEKLKEQGNQCSICSIELTKSVDRKSPIRACQDHDHKTDKLRDILCNRCNLMLGYADDNIKILEKAIAYLQKHANGSLIQTRGIEADKPAFIKVLTDGKPVCST